MDRRWRGSPTRRPGSWCSVRPTAPLALIRGRYRFRLLVKTDRAIDIQSYLRDWLGRSPKPRGNVKVAIDVDPQSFL